MQLLLQGLKKCTQIFKELYCAQTGFCSFFLLLLPWSYVKARGCSGVCFDPCSYILCPLRFYLSLKSTCSAFHQVGFCLLFFTIVDSRAEKHTCLALNCFRIAFEYSYMAKSPRPSEATVLGRNLFPWRELPITTSSTCGCDPEGSPLP